MKKITLYDFVAMYRPRSIPKDITLTCPDWVFRSLFYGKDKTLTMVCEEDPTKCTKENCEKCWHQPIPDKYFTKHIAIAPRHPVNVVRCRDCVAYHKHGSYCDARPVSQPNGKETLHDYFLQVLPDDFCPYGWTKREVD